MPNFKKNKSKFQMPGFNPGEGTEMGSSHLNKSYSPLTAQEEWKGVPFVQDDEYGKEDFEGNVYAQPGGKDYDQMYEDFKAGKYGTTRIGLGDPTWDMEDINDSGSTDDEWERAKQDIHYREGQTTGKQRFKGDREAFDADLKERQRRRGAYQELVDQGYDMSDMKNVDPSMLTQEQIDAMNAANEEKKKAKEEEKLAEQESEETMEGQGDPEAEGDDWSDAGNWRQQRRALRKQLRDEEGLTRGEARRRAKEIVPKEKKGGRQITSADVEGAKSRWNQRRLHRKMLRQQGHSRKDARLAARAATPKRKVSLGFLQKKGNRSFNN
tara:strand:+ start:83 stop:1057 length:975 start_codon:yes stop_codon:yes gene_type:complete